ncbi:MAG: hypothetical protein OXT67_07710 [Zetaproteobacteria bacterium]|nr:hypothetical protein [Zetaproteobacteria bacterium]
MHAPIIFLVNPFREYTHVALVGNRCLGKAHLYATLGLYSDSYRSKTYMVHESRPPHWIEGEVWQLNHPRQWHAIYHMENADSQAQVTPLVVWRYPHQVRHQRGRCILANGFVYTHKPKGRHLVKVQASATQPRLGLSNAVEKVVHKCQKFMASTLH